MGRINIPDNQKTLTPEEILTAIRNNDGHNSDYTVEKLDGVSGSDISVKSEAIDMIDDIPVNETAVYLIGKPEIITPLNGVIGVIDSVIVGNTFNTFNNYEGPHTATDWEVATDSSFNNLVDFSYNDPLNLTSWSATKLTNQVVYFARVRYISDYHVSEWSDYVKFTTGNLVSIETPIVSVEGAPNNVNLTPSIVGSAFNPIGGYEEHRSTDWRVENSTGDIIWESLGDVNNLRFINVPPGVLEYSGSYTFKIRYNGINLESDWGTLLASVHPEPYLIDPEISIDGDPGSINTAPILNGSPFLVKYDTDDHIETNWAIETLDGTTVHTHTSTSGDLTYYVTPPNLLTVGVSYVFKMRYVGVKYTSNWISKTALINLEISVKTPVLYVDTFGDSPGDSDIVTIEPEITTDPFEVLNGFDTHTSTDWRVYKTSDLNNPVWESLDDAVNLETIKLPDQTLEYNTAYRFIAIHKTNNYVSSEGRINKITRKIPRTLDPVFISPDPNDDLSALPQDFILELDNDTGNIILFNDPNTTLDDLDVGVLDRIEYTFTAIQGDSIGVPSPNTITKSTFSEQIGYNLTMGTAYRLDAVIYGSCDVPGSPEVSLVSNTTSLNFEVNFNVVVALPIVTISKDSNGDNDEGNGYNVIVASGTPYTDNTNNQADFYQSKWTLYDIDGVTPLASKIYTRQGNTPPQTTHTFTNLNLKADGVYTVELIYIGFLNNTNFPSQPNTDTVHIKIPPVKTPVVSIEGGLTDVDVDAFKVLTLAGETIPPGLADHVKTSVSIHDTNDNVVYSIEKTIPSLTEIDVTDANLAFDTEYTVKVDHTLEFTTNGVTQQIVSDPAGEVQITTQSAPTVTLNISGGIDNTTLSPFNVDVELTEVSPSDMTNIDSFIHTYTNWKLYYFDSDAGANGDWVLFKEFFFSDATGTHPNLKEYKFDINSINSPPFEANECTSAVTPAMLDYGLTQDYRVIVVARGTVTYSNNTTEEINNSNTFTFNGGVKPNYNSPVIGFVINDETSSTMTLSSIPQIETFEAPKTAKILFEKKVNNVWVPHGNSLIPYIYVWSSDIHQGSIAVSLDNNAISFDDGIEYRIKVRLYKCIYRDISGSLVFLHTVPEELISPAAEKDPPFDISPFNISVDNEIGDDPAGSATVTIGRYIDNKNGNGTTGAQLKVELIQFGSVVDMDTIVINNPANDLPHTVTLTDSNPVQSAAYDVYATYTATNNNEPASEFASKSVGSMSSYTVDKPVVTITTPLSNTNTTQIEFNVSAFNDSENSENDASNYEDGEANLYKDNTSGTPVSTITVPAAGGDLSFSSGGGYDPGTYYIVATYDGDNGVLTATNDSDPADAGTIDPVNASSWSEETTLNTARFGIEGRHLGDINSNLFIIPGGSTNTSGGNISNIESVGANFVIGSPYSTIFDTASQDSPKINDINRAAYIISGSHLFLIGGLDQLTADTGTFAYSQKIARWRGANSSYTYYFELLKNSGSPASENVLIEGRCGHGAWLLSETSSELEILVAGGITGTGKADVLDSQEIIRISKTFPFTVTSVTPLTQTLPEKLNAGIYFTLNGNHYWSGGRKPNPSSGAPNFLSNNQTYRLNTSGGNQYTWSPVTTSNHPPQGCSVVVYGSIAIATGGYDVGNHNSISNEVWVFNGNTWVAGSASGQAIPDITDANGQPYKIAGHASSIFTSGGSDHLVILGGGTYSGTWNITNKVLKFTLP